MRPFSSLPSRARVLRVAVTLLASLLAGCASLTRPADTVTFVVLRHAEKASDDSRDPNLSDAGHDRAHRLSQALQRVDLQAVYATPFRRTQQTAQPTAQNHGLPIRVYPADQDAAELATQLRQQHRHGTALVVGHSITVPGIVAELCQCAVPALADSEYDRWFELTGPADGRLNLKSSRW